MKNLFGFIVAIVILAFLPSYLLADIDVAEAKLKKLELSLLHQLEDQIPQEIAVKPSKKVVIAKAIQPKVKKEVINKHSELATKEAELEKLLKINQQQKKAITSLNQLPKEEEIKQEVSTQYEAKLDQQKTELTSYYEGKLQEVEAALAKTTKESKKTISSLQGKNKALSQELQQVKLDHQIKIDRLNRDLMIATTEVERLSNILEDFNRKTLGLEPINTPSKVVAASERKKPSDTVDLPIVKVAVDKANLRTGPGTNHAPLMELAAGSRLVVEKRSGKWFRVIAPNGVRAWISSEVTEVVPREFGNESSVAVSGYQSDAEQRAMKILRRGR